MKSFTNKDNRKNLSINIFDNEIDDVFTKLGDAIGEVSDDDSEIGHKIGSFLDAITDDWEIKIGKKDK